MDDAALRLADGGQISRVPCGPVGMVLVARYDRVHGTTGPRLDTRIMFVTITEGSISLLIRGKRFDARAGSVIVVPAFTVHAELASPTGWSGVSIHVPPEVVPEALGGKAERLLPVVDLPDIARGLARLPDLCPGDPETAGIVLHAIDQLARRYVCDAPENQELTAQRRAAALACEYLHSLPGDKLPSLAQLSNVAGLSRFYFCRVFRKEVGLSPYAYFAQLRLARARELLRNGAGIAAAAFGAGFSDQSHFTRNFKRYAATTPGEYVRAFARVAAK